MNEKEHNLWLQVEAFELDDPNSSLTFSERLARENNWKLEFAMDVVEEYKKFIFMICISPTPLTPSDEVDQAWHLHLVYTDSYWNQLCGNILGRRIEHGPTKGGSGEQKKYTELYQNTLTLYQNTFGAEAPQAIWPPCHIRFGNQKFKRINTKDYWILRKPGFLRK
jgi:hypothetical protein